MEKIHKICKSYLQGMCTNHNCQKQHCDLPYQWQVLEGFKWTNMYSLENEDTEKNFCDVTSDDIFDDYGKPHLSIIRRLEVENVPDISNLISDWTWYWKDGDGIWIEYEEQKRLQFETLYNEYKNGKRASIVGFMIEEHKYTLDLKTMEQTDEYTGIRRSIRRRRFKRITSDNVKKYREEKLWLNKNYYQRCTDISISTKSYRLEINTYSGEFKKISELFQSTHPEGNIILLERIQNEACWNEFVQQREVMLKRNSIEDNERLLFHGTKQESAEAISLSNFDISLSGKNGHAYGKGIYFASTAKYSHKYAKVDSYNMRRMFVVRVLVGCYALGNSEMCRPPPDSKGCLYDSCVNNVNHPTIFVVFNKKQLYAEYLITYTTP